MFDTHGRKYIDPSINRISKKLNEKKITPKMVTLIALILGIIASVLVAYEQTLLAIVCLWSSGLLDVIDGSLARLSGLKSNSGALMDITFDRVVEIGLIVAFAIRMPSHLFSLLILSVAIILSMTIFLTVGALVPNEGVKSFKYQGGFAERTEGFIFFTLMIAFPSYLSYIAFFFAAAVFVTAIFRFWDGYRVLNSIEKGKPHD